MIFNSQKNISAFTLIELMVVIAIIWITILWATSIDFNRISDAQRSEIFTNNIVAKIETVRNNALIGKWIWASLETPNNWSIEISSSSINTSYDIWAGPVNSSDQSLNITSPYEVNSLKCLSLDKTSEVDITWSPATLSFAWNNLSFIWGCNNDEYKILEITTLYKTHEKVISINTLSWLIEID